MSILNLDQLSKEHNILFNQVALDTRLPFNTLVEHITMPHVNNIHWIVGSIASRNKYNSPLFYRCCQLAFIRKYEEVYGMPDEIILSDKPVANLLKKQLKGIRITCTESTVQTVWRFFRPCRQFLLAVYFFVLRFFARSEESRVRLQGKKDIILVETFVLNNKPGDGGSITDGKYIDRYYPGMLEVLTDGEKSRIYFLPTTVGFKNFGAIFKKIRAADYPFVLHDDFLKLQDYFFILTHPFRLLGLPVGDHSFAGFTLKNILLQEKRRNCSDFISLLGILNYRFARRLKEAGIDVRILVDWYENQVMDRGMIAGFHRYLPETFITGYQGYVISKGLHVYAQPNQTEFTGSAVPDTVTVTGEGLKNNILEFCKNANVRVAPGFRFGKIWRKRKHYPDLSQYTVLLGLPIGLDDSKYILELISSNTELMIDLRMRFFVKPHPTWSPEKIQSMFPKGALDKMTFMIGDFHDVLETVDLVISNASSVSLEALAKGVPVIIVAPATGVLQNPIPEEISKSCWSIAYTASELQQQIYNYMHKRDSKTVNFEKIGDEIREQYFAPVTRENVLHFLHQQQS